MKQKCKVLGGGGVAEKKWHQSRFFYTLPSSRPVCRVRSLKLGHGIKLSFSWGDSSLNMHSPECPGWFSFLSLNAADEKGAHSARNSTSMSREPRPSSASSQRLKGWRRRTSSPERDFLRPGLGSAGDLPWHVPHSRPSSLQLPWTPLSCRCWLPSSAARPVSWLALCWRCCCWPLESWTGSSDTLRST